MNLLDLPTEILDTIIDYVIVVTQGWNDRNQAPCGRPTLVLDRIREARLVCKRFDSIATRQAYRNIDWRWWRGEKFMHTKHRILWLLHEKLLLEAEKEAYSTGQSNPQDLAESTKEPRISDEEIKSILRTTDSLKNASRLTVHYQGEYEAGRQMADPNSGPWLPRILRATLSIFAYCDNEHLVRQLLDRGYDVNTTEERFGPPFYAAVAGGNVRMAGLLLSYGADPNCIGCRDTPLAVATRDANKYLVRLLLQHPTIDPNLNARFGNNALFESCRTGNVAITRQILGHPKTVHNLGSYWSDSPLQIAVYYGHTEITKLFVCRESFTEPGNECIVSALWQAAAYDQNGCFRSILGALNKDSNLDDYKREGNTVLWWAAFWGHASIVQAYLEHTNVDVNAAGMKGDTALWQASYRGREDIVGLLLQRDGVALNEPCSLNLFQTENVHKGDIEGTDHTPFSIAVAAGHIRVVELLLKRQDIMINCLDSRSRTPLVIASQYGREEIAGLLLQRDDLDIGIEDHKNRTAPQMAALMGRENILSMIIARYPEALNTANSKGFSCFNYSLILNDPETRQKLLELSAVADYRRPY